MKQLYLTLMFLLPLSLSAQSLDTRKMKQLDALFDTIESHDQGMGSLSLYYKGREVYQRSIGFADVENNIRASADTRYRVGSITKSLTAAIILQMVEEGKIALSTTLSTYYPEFESADLISIEHMLNHTSGLNNFTNSPEYPSREQETLSEQDLVEWFVQHENLFPPGEKQEYSNTAYVLLSLIAEKVDKKPFAEIVQDRLSKPLQLDNTYIGGKIGDRPNEAHSYSAIDGWVRHSETDMSLPRGAGAIVSTAGDINKFYSALFTGKLLKPATLEQMKPKSDYGFGLALLNFYDKKVMGHDGSIDRFLSSAGHFESEELTGTYLSNWESFGINDILIGVLSIYFDKPYELPDFEKMSLVLAIPKIIEDPDAIKKVQTLLDQGADINAQNSQGETALIIAGFIANKPELMKFLIERGADVNVANINGDTALIDAAYFGRNENLEILLENGAKPEIKNKRFSTAMDVAKKNEHNSTVKLLEAHGN